MILPSYVNLSKSDQASGLQFLICEMGRRILALSDIPQLLTGMLKLDTGSCKTRVLSRLFPSGRMGDWGRLDTVVHLLLGSPPNKSCSPILLCSSGRYWLISWPLPRARLHLEPGHGVWKLPQGSPSASVVLHRWHQLSGGPLLEIGRSTRLNSSHLN